MSLKKDSEITTPCKIESLKALRLHLAEREYDELDASESDIWALREAREMITKRIESLGSLKRGRPSSLKLATLAEKESTEEEI
jgi:hypothetical protein